MFQPRTSRCLTLSLLCFGLAACSGSEPGTADPSGGGGNAPGNPAAGGTAPAASGGVTTTLGGRRPVDGSTQKGGTAASTVSGPAVGGSSTGGTPVESSRGGNQSTTNTIPKGGSAALGGTTSRGGSSSSAKGGSAALGGSSAKGGASNAGGSISGGASGACIPPKTGTSKTNPLFTDQYTADPGAMVDNCTFYIACGHDEGSTGFVMREWFVLKSTDMVTWTKKVGMTLSTFAWADANAWAGQMVKAKNGKYYWYVPVNERGAGMAIGVAVADSPDGPWKDALGKPLVNDASEMANFNYTDAGQTAYTIDPTVFVDDDGQAYLHYGGFWRMVQAKLGSDMISIAGKMTESTPASFFEAPYLMKNNGIYYEIYAAGSANPTTIDYATSNSPLGPWTRKGTILGTMPKVAGQDEPTNHAAIAQFAGQWYIVYHVSNGPNGGGTYKREVAVDKLNFNSDGSIQKVTPSASLAF